MGRRLLVLMSLILFSGPSSAVAWHSGLPHVALGPDLQGIQTWIRAGKNQEAIARLDQLLPHLKKDQRTIGTFLLGKLLVIQKSPRAQKVLEGLPRPLKDLEDRRVLWLRRAGGGKVGQSHPNWTRRERYEILIKDGNTLLERGDKVGVLELLGSLKKPRFTPYEAAEVLALQAQASPALEAAKLFRKLAIKYPSQPATRRLRAKLSPLALTSQQRLRRAQRLAKSWEYESAVTELEKLLAEGYRKRSVRWLLATILQDKLRTAPDKVRTYLRYFRKRPEHRYHQEAVYRTMRAYIKEDRYSVALKLGKALLERFPDSPYREAISYYSGWLLYDQNKCRKAVPELRRHMRKYRNRRTVIRGFIAWCRIRDGKWKKAIRAFKPLLRQSHVIHRGKALYWQAYALNKLNRRPEALLKLETLVKEFPLTYYWMLAHQLRATWQGKSARASAQPWPDARGATRYRADRLRLQTHRLKLPQKLSNTFNRVRRLVAVGELGEARRAYRPIKRKIERYVPMSRRKAFMQTMCDAIEDYHDCWKRSGLRVKSGAPNAKDRRWRMAYPEAYRPVVERAATRFGISPHFVYAIMRAESRYLPTAVSHAEAVGALQMIRPTARKVAQEIKVIYDPVTFWNPVIAFPYSVFYLKKHEKLWHGQLIPTAASYNAGPEPVGRWMKTPEGRRLPFLVEEFVYNEARNYSRKVAGYLLTYLYLYQPDPKKRAPILDALFPAQVNTEVPENLGY